MLRYQRLGFVNMKEMQQAWDCLQIEIPEIGSICPRQDRKLYSDTKICYKVLYYEHLQTNHPFENTQSFLKKGIELCREYFYGKWRDSFQEFYYTPVLTREECRLVVDWIPELTYGFLFALLLNDSKSLLNLADYIDDDLTAGFGGDCYGKPLTLQYYVYWKILAYGVKNNTLVGCKEDKSKIEHSSRRIYKLLLACLESLFSKNVDIFNTSFTKYMNLFIKQVTDPKKKTSEWSYYFMSLDGSILWNYANNVLGLDMPEFPEEIMDRILTSHSCGLQK